MQLSRPKTENPISTVPPSIFSTVTDSLTNGYLAFAQANKLESTPDDPKVLEAKRKAEEERKKAEEEQAKQKLIEQQQKEQEELIKQETAIRSSATSEIAKR